MSEDIKKIQKKLEEYKKQRNKNIQDFNDRGFISNNEKDIYDDDNWDQPDR